MRTPFAMNSRETRIKDAREDRINESLKILGIRKPYTRKKIESAYERKQNNKRAIGPNQNTNEIQAIVSAHYVIAANEFLLSTLDSEQQYEKRKVINDQNIFEYEQTLNEKYGESFHITLANNTLAIRFSPDSAVYRFVSSKLKSQFSNETDMTMLEEVKDDKVYPIIFVPIGKKAELLHEVIKSKPIEELYTQTTEELKRRLEWLTKPTWGNRLFTSNKVKKSALAILEIIEKSKNLSTDKKMLKLNIELLKQESNLLSLNKFHFFRGNPIRAIKYGLTNNSSQLKDSDENTKLKNINMSALISANFKNYKSRTKDLINKFNVNKLIPDTYLTKIKNKIADLKLDAHKSREENIGKFIELEEFLQSERTPITEQGFHLKNKLIKQLLEEIEIAKEEMGLPKVKLIM